MTIATAAKQVIVDRMEIVVAGGVESISLVQTPELRVEPDPDLAAMHPDIYMSMLETAEIVAAPLWDQPRTMRRLCAAIATAHG